MASREAVTRAVCLEVTVPAVRLKEADVAPGRTFTEAGVVSRVLLSERVTVLPPGGAGPVSVTVQVARPPEAMEKAGQVRELMPRLGVTVSVAVLEFEPMAAVSTMGRS